MSFTSRVLSCAFDCCHASPYTGARRGGHVHGLLVRLSRWDIPLSVYALSASHGKSAPINVEMARLHALVCIASWMDIHAPSLLQMNVTHVQRLCEWCPAITVKTRDSDRSNT